MYRVSTGEIKICKGWNCFKLDENGNKLPKTFVKVSKEDSIKTEEDFYEWVKDKKLIVYDTVRNIERPNPIVFRIIKRFNKVDEFFGEFFNQKKLNKIKKSCEYNKTCSDKEFKEWIKKQNLYRADGKPNSRVFGVVKYRGAIEEFYPNYQ